jgi:hypothetical protein
MWILARNPAQWMWALLPFSHRVTLVFGNGGQTCWAFSRVDATAVRRLPWEANCSAVLDCIVDSPEWSRFAVYDAMMVGDKNYCAADLQARLGAVLCDFASAQCAGVATYLPADHVIVETARQQCCASNRILFVDPTQMYRPAVVSRDACTWKPPIAAGHAILCCRCGEAMSLAAEDNCLLWCEGPAAGQIEHMQTYECEYVRETQSWLVVRRAKRGEPLFTREQTKAARHGAPSPDGVHELAEIFPAPRPVKIRRPKPDGDGFTLTFSSKKRK